MSLNELTLSCLILFGCLSGRSAAAQIGPSEASQETAPPALVVTIVVDQFSANLFNQYRGQFTGGLRTLIDQGHVYVNGYQAQGCGSASKSDPLSPRNITLIQYVISYRVGSRLRRRSTSQASAQRFLTTHAAIYNTFSIQRHLISRPTLRRFRADADAAWGAAVA